MQFLLNFMAIICLNIFFTRITTNWTRILLKIFLLFVSALALFLASPYAKKGFSIFFLSEAFFYSPLLSPPDQRSYKNASATW
jgi:hypothetical protein